MKLTLYTNLPITLPWILGADGSSELGLWGGVAYIGLCKGLRTLDVGLDLIRRLHCWSFCVKVIGVNYIKTKLLAFYTYTVNYVFM